MNMGYTCRRSTFLLLEWRYIIDRFFITKHVSGNKYEMIKLAGKYISIFDLLAAKNGVRFNIEIKH